MNDIKPNSHKYKEEVSDTEEPKKVKLKPVVAEGKARTRKVTSISKVAGSIISEDAHNVKSYIVMDVLIPSIKKAIQDIVTNGIDIILYGEAGRTKRSNASGVSYRNYRDYSGTSASRPSGRDSRDIDRSSRTNRDSVSLFESVVLDTKVECDEVLSRMGEYLEVYDIISVADLYDLANISTFPHTYHNYGWSSVADAKIVRVHDGWRIDMPPVKSLKQ